MTRLKNSLLIIVIIGFFALFAQSYENNTHKEPTEHISQINVSMIKNIFQ